MKKRNMTQTKNNADCGCEMRDSRKGLFEKNPLRKSALIKADARTTGRTIVDMPVSKLPKKPRGIPKVR